MTQPVFIVTATGTGIGKTVFAAGLVCALDGNYWKPVQAGLDGPTDSETAARLSGLPPSRFLPEGYRLRAPASPHIAAKRDNVFINPHRLNPPPSDRPLVIEGAGGLMAPLTRRALQIDTFARWGAPAILCVKTELGCINHSLLSLEALKARSIPVFGVAFLGREEPEMEETIIEIGGVRRLGRLPFLPILTPASLAEAFEKNFRVEEFLA